MNKKLLWIIALFLLAIPFVNAITNFNTSLSDYWNFNTNTTSFRGYPCNNNSGQVNSTMGKAWSFNGVNQRLVCFRNDTLFNLPIERNFTFSFVTNITTVPSVGRAIGIGLSTNLWTLSPAGTTWGGGTKSNVYFNTGGEFTTNAFTGTGVNHWIFTRIGTNFTIYRNGAVHFYNLSSVSASSPQSNLTFGARESTAGSYVEFYNGSLDEMYIWMDRGLNQSEVIDAFNCFNSSSSLINCVGIVSNQFSFNGLSTPVNNSNFAQSYINITQNATLVNNTINCSLVFDDLIVESKIYSNLTNQTYFFNINFYRENLTYSLHNYSISCKDITNNTYNTVKNYFYLWVFILNAISETTNQNISENLTLLFRGLNNNFDTTFINSAIRLQNISSDEYRLDIYPTSSSNYSRRTYYVTLSGISSAEMNAYLLPSASTTNVTFSVRDDLQNLLNGVTLTFTKLINGNYVTVGQKQTDISGTALVNLQSGEIYKIYVSANNYQTKVFNLEINSDLYSILLNRNTSVPYTEFQHDVSYSISPISSIITPSDQNNFTISVNSPDGFVNYFGSGTSNVTGSPNGGTAIYSLNTTGLTSFQVNYFLNTQGGMIEFNRTYYVYDYTQYSNETVQGGMCEYVDQINAFYRFLIAIFVALIIGAGFFVLLGTVGSTVIAWLTFLGFSLGTCPFVPIWFQIIPGIIITIGYFVVGGNDGT